jgi:hypothetical protein
MQRRAVLVAIGVVLAVGFALARFGMIGPDESATVGDETMGTATDGSGSGMAAAIAPETQDAAKVRVWLHQRVTERKALTLERINELIVDLDEDPSDQSRLVLLPSGRTVPKAARGAPDGWTEGHLWPTGARAAPGSAGSAEDLHNLRAAEPSFAREAIRYDDDPPGVHPADRLKGDVARALFYMDIRYDGQDGGPALTLVESEAEPGAGRIGQLCTLLRWNELDPVDLFERRRNEWIAKRQGTSNPFVEQPEFARVLWGRECS